MNIEVCICTYTESINPPHHYGYIEQSLKQVSAHLFIDFFVTDFPEVDSFVIHIYISYIWYVLVFLEKIPLICMHITQGRISCNPPPKNHVKLLPCHGCCSSSLLLLMLLLKISTFPINESNSSKLFTSIPLTSVQFGFSLGQRLLLSNREWESEIEDKASTLLWRSFVSLNCLHCSDYHKYNWVHQKFGR